MRIALCLSGELRTFYACRHQLRHHLIDKYGIKDVFCHFWWDGKGTLPFTKMKYWDESKLDSEYNAWPARVVAQLRDHPEVQYDGNPVEMLNSIYPISGVSYTTPFWKAWGRYPGPETEQEYRNWMEYLRSYGPFAGQPNPDNINLPPVMREWFHDYNRSIFYSQSAAAALKRAHEREHGRFDLVIRTRYDVGFSKDTPTLQELEAFFAKEENLMMRENSGISYDNIYIYRSDTHDSFTTGIYDNLDLIRDNFTKRPQTSGTPEAYQHMWAVMEYDRKYGEPTAVGLNQDPSFFDWGLEIIRHPDQVIELDKRILEQ